MSPQQSLTLYGGVGRVTKYEIPRVVMTFFLFYPSFSKAILRTSELPSLCNVVSSIYQLFNPHFAMAVLIYVYLFTLSYK